MADYPYVPEEISIRQESDITNDEVLEDILLDDQFDIDDSELLDSSKADEQAEELLSLMIRIYAEGLRAGGEYILPTREPTCVIWQD